MVTCGNCNTENQEGAKFCSGCGAQFQVQQTQGPQPAPMCSCGRGPVMKGKNICSMCWAESKTGMV